jgi:hypothetical protein
MMRNDAMKNGSISDVPILPTLKLIAQSRVTMMIET